MKILFLHGWQSTPGGVKPTYFEDHGHEVLNPALPDDDFDATVRIAQAEYDLHHPDAVVGSSRGGAVAMNLKIDVPLVLLCPAWKRWGMARTVPSQHTMEMMAKAATAVCQPVYGIDQRWLGQRASNRDITDRKRAELELRERIEALEKRLPQRKEGLRE